MSKKASVAIAMVKNGGVYLMQRTGTETYRDCWAFAGGHIEQGETPLDAAKREFKEETGLNPVFYDFEFVCINEREPDYLCVVYSVDFRNPQASKPQNTEPHKHSDWKWFSFEDVTEIDKIIPGIRSIVASHLMRSEEFR
jgi:8-oxo-dGTP diphosphatase